YTLRVAPYFSDINGTTTSAQFAEKAFTMPITQPAPLNTLEVILPQKKGDVLTFSSGWDTGKITPDSTNSTFVDTKGNSQFVYSSSIQDNVGKVLWSSEDTLALGAAKLLAGYETCAGVLHTATTGDMSYWDCSKNYVPADVTAALVAGKTYTLRTSLRADLTSPLAEPLTKTFVMPDLTPVNPAPTDTTAPKVVSATSLTQNKVKVIFSEPVKLPAAPESAFSIQANNNTQDVLKVVSVNPDPNDTTGTVYILLTADPKSSTAYVITASKTITDLAGNAITVGTNDYASFTSPAAGATVPSSMTLKNLSVKKLTDGNVAVTYTIDIGGSSIDTIGSEVHLNDSKTFVAKFTEGVKTGVTSYTYEAILLPWEIAPGDIVKIVMNGTGVVVNYVNDGQTVTYKGDAQIQDAVVGLVTANALPAATVGSPYSTAIVVKDGTAPYKYVLASTSTLPDGLTLDPLTGVLSGTPTKDGSYSFSLSVTDAKNTALNATFTLKIVPAPVAGTVTTTTGGTTIINNYTTYSGTGGLPYVPYVAPALPSNRYLFPINLGSSRFEDVAYHWARNYINVLWNAGYVQGYNVRKFGPDDSLTRGQLLKIVMESLHYKLPTKVAFDPCVDVQTNMWYAKYFAVAREKGIIGGYVDGTCRPNKLTNRAESLKILYAAIAQMPELPVTKITPTVPAGYRNTFYDLNEGSWYYPYFANAQSLGIISGFADETARPESELSRAQMAKIVVLTMQKLAWNK
ncbi:MAG: S-layer homology domain-containing protein, partial [Candidatus Peregrinibacteria bacterium]|nr:S-layer homology domain-containing protein [Candidatus Peregrinibacteria bacterium]